MQKLWDGIFFSVMMVWIVAMFASFLAGFSIWFMQALKWLQTGVYPEAKLGSALRIIEAMQPWIDQPQDWIGLHSIVAGANLGLSFFILGTMMLIIFSSILK